MAKVVLFGDIVGPYGDAYLNPRRPGSYHKTLHGLASEAGFMPFFKPTLTTISNTAPLDLRGIEWEDANGIPFILMFGAANATGTPQCFRITSTGAIVAETIAGVSIAAKDLGICGALHSNGSTSPLFFLGYGASATAQYRDQAGTWTACTGTPSQLNGFFSENGNLWGILTNGYQVRKWPAGTHPGTGTANAAIDVGTSAWPITGYGLLEGSRVVFVKPDGIYIYDVDTNRFENLWPGLSQVIHKDTGKGTITFGSELLMPLGWGGMVAVSLSHDPPVFPVSPILPDYRPDQTTPGQAKVTAMANDASHLYALARPFDRFLDPGLAGTKVLDGSATDRTANLTDDDPNTTGMISGAAGAQTIYAGSTTARFAAFYLEIAPGGSNSVAGQIYVLEYWNGTAWTSIAFKDYSRFMQDGAIMPDSPIPSDWAQTIVNGFLCYWLRYRQTAGIAISFTLREVRLIPEVAALTAPDGTALNQWARDEQHCTTHLLRGYRQGDGIFWEDIATLDGDYSSSLLFSRILAGQGRTLMLIGPISYARFRLGFRVNPDQLRDADCTGSFPSMHFTPYDDRLAQDQRAPTLLKGVRALEFFVRDFSRGDDVLQAFINFDGRGWLPLGKAITEENGRIELEVPHSESGMGYTYAVAAALKDTTRGATVPKITAIVANVYADRKASDV